MNILQKCKTVGTLVFAVISILEVALLCVLTLAGEYFEHLHVMFFITASVLVFNAALWAFAQRYNETVHTYEDNTGETDEPNTR